MILKCIITLLLAGTVLLPSYEIAMLGIKINDPKKIIETVKLEQIAMDDHTQKFRTENGNDFSVTVENGKVVYMENDWLQSEKGVVPLFSKFRFGETSLKDIRAKFSTNGYTYKSQSIIQTKTHVILFNCFEFDSENNEVLVIVTKVSLKEDVSEKNLACHAKLDALILANKSYLGKIWGKEKSFDPNYKKIKP